MTKFQEIKQDIITLCIKNHRPDVALCANLCKDAKNLKKAFGKIVHLGLDGPYAKDEFVKMKKRLEDLCRTRPRVFKVGEFDGCTTERLEHNGFVRVVLEFKNDYDCNVDLENYLKEQQECFQEMREMQTFLVVGSAQEVRMLLESGG